MKLESSPFTDRVRVSLEGIKDFKEEDYVELIDSSGSIRSGQAQIGSIDYCLGIINFIRYNLNTYIPAAAICDVFRKYKKPCKRCICEDCEKFWEEHGRSLK